MNCQTARQTLELLRPDENASSTSGEAEQHVRDCLDCQDAVRTQQQLDLRIGRVCRDVSVPVGLKDRLLSGLAAADAEVDGLNSGEFSDGAGEFQYDEEGVSRLAVVDPTVAGGDRRFADAGSIGNGAVASRRRWLMQLAGSVAAFCLVAAAGVWWSLRPVVRKSTLDEVTMLAMDAAPAGMTAFQAFHNGIELKMPGTMSTVNLKGAPLQLGERDVAMYFFTIGRRAGKPIQGRLIVIPKAALSELPTATSFLAVPPSYKPPYGITAWVEGDLVYVCFVNGGEVELSLLRRPTV